MTTYKENALQLLFKGAEEYLYFLGYDFILYSEKFKFRKFYILRFYEDNFLHLTGVQTKLNAKEFFSRSINKTLTLNDFDCDSSKTLKKKTKLKLKHLINISYIFHGEVFFQESFSKGKVKCIIAGSNNKFTLGFTGGNNALNPISLLNKNLLDINLRISDVKIKIIKRK